MKSLFRFVFFLLFLSITFPLWAQETQGFSSEKYEGSKDKNLLYRQFVPPNVEEGKAYPLVIFLHGAGERGNDNLSQLKHVTHRLVDSALQGRYPSFVIAPQCPQGIYWSAGKFDRRQGVFLPKKKISAEQRMLIGLIEDRIEALPIDPERVYLCGLSMGAFGSWELLSRRPDLFAAAIPICGGGNPETAGQFAHLPIWVFHGTADNVVPVEMSRNMVKALGKAGGQPIYTEFPGVGHNSWDPAFSEAPYLYDWLFAQKRK
ncbi:MAG: PHB depolymerase family esterase [Bacteroidota bacterium]